MNFRVYFSNPMGEKTAGIKKPESVRFFARFKQSASRIQDILIDPVMSDRTSPVGFAGPARFAEYALDTDGVPEIDTLSLM